MVEKIPVNVGEAPATNLQPTSPKNFLYASKTKTKKTVCEKNMANKYEKINLVDYQVKLHNDRKLNRSFGFSPIEILKQSTSKVFKKEA